MCYTGGPYCDNNAKARLEKSKIAFNLDPSMENRNRIKAARYDYYLSMAGIKELGNSGKIEEANKYLKERERLIIQAKAEGKLTHEEQARLAPFSKYTKKNLTLVKAKLLVDILDTPEAEFLYNKTTKRLMNESSPLMRAKNIQKIYAMTNMKPTFHDPDRRLTDPALLSTLEAMGHKDPYAAANNHYDGTMGGNFIGSSLEFFISSELEKIKDEKWIQARGGMLHNTDLIEANTRLCVQIKNSDTSQNSTSKRTMGAFNAITWSRRTHSSGNSHWESFLGGKYIDVLNEKKFLSWNKKLSEEMFNKQSR